MHARNRKVEISLGIVVLIAVVAGLYLMQTRKAVSRGPKTPQTDFGVRSVGPQIIESELLPLRLLVDRVSERQNMQIGGGAIESTGSELLIMDRMGKGR